MEVSNSSFSGNTAVLYDGGGISSQLGPLIVSKSTFSNNAAGAGSGGGIFFNGGSLTVNNSTFSENSASNGGGIEVPIGSADGKQQHLLWQ